MNFSETSNYPNILVLRLSSMGDIILTSHLIRILSKLLPESEIDFCTSNEFTEIYKFNPRIKSLFEYNKSKDIKSINLFRNEFLASKGIEKYDLILDLQNNPRSRYFTNGIGSEIIRYPKNRLNKLSLVYFKRALKPLHVTSLYFRTLEKFCAVDDDKGLEFWLPDEMNLYSYPPENKKNYFINGMTIAIAPGAFHFTKRWPVEKFSILIGLLLEKFKCEIILLGGSKDSEICSQLRKTYGNIVKNYCGTTSLIGTARKLDTCDLLITNDTGVMHIAAARKIPIVSLFGSTVPELGFTPFRTPHRIIQNNITCRPCSHIGRMDCPKKHFNCMMGIDPEKVLIEVNSLISELKA